jgi:hypothetical protein
MVKAIIIRMILLAVKFIWSRDQKLLDKDFSNFMR